MPEGPTPGPDAPEGERTAWSFALLLAPEDLPGRGWRVVEERSWPTGQLDSTSAKSRRAAGAGGMTAWRKLIGADRAEAWVEVVPYASVDDARIARGQVSTYFVGVVPDGGSIIEEVTVDRPVDGLDDPWILDKTTSGAAGVRRARTVCGALGSLLVLTCLSGPVERWTWDEALELATRQAERVSRTAPS